MNKLISATCFTALATLAPLTQADTILGIYAGAGVWNADYSGDTGVVGININELGLSDESNNFYYIALEHPIPLIPNIRLQHTDISSREQGTLTRSFQLDNIVFSASETVITDLDLSHTDAILYYEILDNWLNLDLGLNLRSFDGFAEVTSVDTPTLTESVNLEGVVPMGYVKVQVDLPLTGFSVGADANITSYSGNTLSDMSVKVAYAFDAVVDLGIELGYRRFALKLKDVDDLEADMTIDGPYAAVTLHF